jgi:hypothetical protein
MPRWFLSFHSPDQPLAERLIAAIERKDPALSIFFAPAHLRAGGAWTDQLARELATADAFILLVGEAGVGKWQILEYYEALDRRVKSGGTFPLIVVLLEGQTTPGLSFLRQLPLVVTPDPAVEHSVARIFDAVFGGARASEPWRYASPYRGLEAMDEKDSDYFFGRTRETVEALHALEAQGRLPVLIGNSGVGKSSIAQAGVIAALKRQAWPANVRASNAWPAVFVNSRQWCFVTLRPGSEPIKALVDCFLDTWQFSATDPERMRQWHGWIELLHEKATLSDLIDATERRRQSLDQPKPPAFFLYVDQGDELYVRAEERERLRFSELLAEALHDPRLRAMMSMRTDFLGYLQRDAPLFRARLQVDVPPLGEAELREVVSRPAELLGAYFENERLIDIIAQRAAEDSVKDVGALPLLSYTLDDMWGQMLKAGDGVLRLHYQFFELGGVLVDRANAFLASHPGSEDLVRRIFALRLAAVREDGEPMRRRAARAEFPDEEWRLVSELSGYPNRLLVTAVTESGQTYAEVTHEAIFRHWRKLKEWIAEEREFLAWRSGLQAARHAWEKTPDRYKDDALLTGFALTQARGWLAKRSADLSEADRAFIGERQRVSPGFAASVEGWVRQQFTPSRPKGSTLRVFLCHASEDKKAVRSLYQELKVQGFSPWLDEEDLIGGQDWDAEITRAIRQSDTVLVCLSQHFAKRGYVNKEIARALDVAEEQPAGSIFLIPVRLEVCDVPERLKRLQWVDLYEQSGRVKLQLTLETAAQKLIRGP